MPFSFSQTSKDRRKGIDPRLIEISDLSIQISPIDFGIPPDGGIRSAQRQKELFDQNKSKCDGYSQKSYHQSGLALDVCAYVEGKASWDELHLTTVATAMLRAANLLRYNLEWGGLWQSFVDMPHFQLVD